MEALNHGSGFITRELGKRMQLRALPKLNFKLDNSIEYSVHISEIIDSLHKNEK
ncbi:MAG: ribosome-binding factor A [Christensenellales bacterium]